MTTTVAATIGDVAGIGPEIMLRAVLDERVRAAVEVVLVGSAQVIVDQARHFGLQAALAHLTIHDVEGPVAWKFGEISAECGAASIGYVQEAVKLAKRGRVDALVTAPINKESWKAAAVPYPGHTEALGILFERSVETMFVAGPLRIFFLTRHHSLRRAIDQLNAARLTHLLVHADATLRQLGVERPRIAVAALNPHGGEHGLFGDEEEVHLRPGIVDAIRAGVDAHGPVPSDAVFYQAVHGRYDAVIALFHDQGHIAAKMHDFFGTVSVTTGLPVIRATVDHGTAFDIAGRGIADPSGQVQAFVVADELAQFVPNPARKRTRD